MSKTPIEMMMDGIEWKPVEFSRVEQGTEGIPGGLYATHEGVFELMGKSMRCYRLNSGQAFFNADDFEAFWSDLAGDTE